MPPSLTTSQKASVTQFMSITGVPERNAQKVSCLKFSPTRKEHTADSSFVDSYSRLQDGNSNRLVKGKLFLIHTTFWIGRNIHTKDPPGRMNTSIGYFKLFSTTRNFQRDTCALKSNVELLSKTILFAQNF